MTDPISIPIRHGAHGTTCAVIDADIASQIVSLALADVCHPLNEHERRIAALEAWRTRHQPVKIPPTLILNPHGPPVSGNGAGCLMTRKDQPAGDDAAVEALMRVKYTAMDYACNGFAPHNGSAKAIIAAIRRGEVPNIVDATVLSDERGLLAGLLRELLTYEGAEGFDATLKMRAETLLKGH